MARYSNTEYNSHLPTDLHELDLSRVISFPTRPGSKLSEFLPSMGRVGLDLLQKMLAWGPSIRTTASAALKHEFFVTDPLPDTSRSLPSSLHLLSGGKYSDPAQVKKNDIENYEL